MAEAGPDRYMHPDRIDGDCGLVCRASDVILIKEQLTDNRRTPFPSVILTRVALTGAARHDRADR